MKNTIRILLAVCVATVTVAAGQAKNPCSNDIKLCSYNIRGDMGRDSLNNWVYRKDSLCRLILRHDFDIVCLQEAMANQLADIELRTGYAFAGIRGLYNPIFYKADRFELLHNETFWLSESMLPFSKGWDGKYDRYCTWMHLRDRRSGQTFYVFNAHLDHRGINARREGAALICTQARKYAGDEPLFICGDMNSQEDTEAYAAYASCFRDARKTAERVTGPEGTAHNFGRVAPIRIDYIFTDDHIRIVEYGTDDEQYPGKRYPSDHYPVFVRARFIR